MDVKCLYMGFIVSAPVVVPLSMAYGLVSTPAFLVKALCHKSIMSYHQHKSGFKHNIKEFNKIQDQISDLDDLAKLKHAKNQTNQNIKLNLTIERTKVAAMCIIPFGVYLSFLVNKNPGTLGMNSKDHLEAVKKALDTKIKTVP